MEVPDIINYLESQYHTKLQDGSIKKELPDTNGDEKPKDIRSDRLETLWPRSASNGSGDSRTL